MQSNLTTVAARSQFLRLVPLFSKLSQAELETIARDIRPHTFKRHTVIFHQEDPSQELYIVRTGKVRVFRRTISGNETSINLFSPCDILGEFAALDRQPRSATAVALSTCVLWAIDSDIFLHHLRSMPELTLEMNRMLVNKIRWTAAYAETVAQYDAAGRLLHILLLYNAQFGEPIVAGKQFKLDLGLTQDDLASLVGARREWVNRLLQEWRRKDLLIYQAG
ncbi:MAG TPA: Crp/Fnr family transcriptional regulator, partial [Herpetosiphonaceae bacterium]|nr:Crp/Fnr family transcriptional regulator [Herpetosiphonaceae bacterium]